jgi:signal transduction histidine kinase
MGIPLAEQSRLFQRFFRSTLATANAIQGTGLGLHIVRSIAEAHDGSADCESTPGVGTTFRILLPTSLPASDEPEDVQDDEDQERDGRERDGSTDGEPAELL